MWETSTRPAAVRTALCSSMMPVYWTGISQPAKGTMRAPRRRCSGWRQVRRRASLILATSGSFMREVGRHRSLKAAASIYPQCRTFQGAVMYTRFFLLASKIRSAFLQRLPAPLRVVSARGGQAAQPRVGGVHGDDQRPPLQRPFDDALLGLQRDQRQDVEGGDPGDAIQHHGVLGQLADVYRQLAAGVRLHDAVVGGMAGGGDQAQPRNHLRF